MRVLKFFGIAASAPLLARAAYVVGPNNAARALDNRIYLSTDLELFQPNSTVLEKRVQISDCLKVIDAVNKCFTFVNNIRSVASYIGNLIFSDSQNADCSDHSGDIDGVQFSFYYQGGGCSTTADITTIRGAIAGASEDFAQGRCAQVCIQMKHGGATVS
ncbi:hypothetical protein FB45DRAFT_758336 [Roridomyces roridus]|uniref:Secreted protein CSS2 C-terminal domain-containing protein n=1 Tax=Roridomyces roridus TaxID=1738132 RepID=A0AAD7BAM1_9AGAR|nr:hypothetical protein FB45DRAFT_758336 [Roridomyces roridus]